MSEENTQTAKTDKKETQPKEKKLTVEQRIDRLEAIVCKFAHYAGGGLPSIIKEFGLEVYSPSKDEMRKHRG